MGDGPRHSSSGSRNELNREVRGALGDFAAESNAAVMDFGPEE